MREFVAVIVFMLMKPDAVVAPSFCCCDSEVFRSRARSVWPSRVASVTGVSPSAFLACTDAPLISKYLASSSFGCCPQQRCSAVSPFEFFKSKSESSRLLRNFKSFRLFYLTAKCSKVFS